MSRSHRYHSIIGVCGGRDSEKKFKRNCNHKFRARQRRILKEVQFDLEGDVVVKLPHRLRDVMEPWGGPKDGKMYFGNWDDLLGRKKCMRK
jgi:hypothetical protein